MPHTIKPEIGLATPFWGYIDVYEQTFRVLLTRYAKDITNEK
jgi:hypothetical protein